VRRDPLTIRASRCWLHDGVGAYAWCARVPRSARVSWARGGAGMVRCNARLEPWASTQAFRVKVKERRGRRLRRKMRRCNPNLKTRCGHPVFDARAKARLSPDRLAFRGLSHCSLRKASGSFRRRFIHILNRDVGTRICVVSAELARRSLGDGLARTSNSWPRGAPSQLMAVAAWP